MDIQLNKKSPIEASIKITLKEPDYQPKVVEKVKEYARKAQLKGFRKGKVPSTVIQQMYGKSILVEEINHILSHALQDYIKENKLKLIGEPIPDIEKTKDIDWLNQDDFEFDYDIGLVEDFDYDIAKKLKVKSYEIEVDDKSINETSENLRLQNGVMTNPKISESGDSVFGVLSEVNGEFSVECLIDIPKMEKKYTKSFIGVKKGDSIEFKLKKAITDITYLTSITSLDEDKLKSLKEDFNFDVKNVNRKVKAEMNQEFFDKVFGPGTVSSEGAFNEKLKEEILKNYHRESDYFLDRTIIDTLVSNTKINLPDEFLKRWLKFSNEEKITDEMIEKEFDNYITELKWSLLKNRITEDNELKVEHEDVIVKAKELIREQFGQLGQSEQLEKNIDSFADNYLKGEEGKNYMKVFNMVQYSKIMALLKEKANISQKKVKPEEFQKIVSK